MQISGKADKAVPTGDDQIVLASGAEAVEVARELAGRFAAEAGERDRNRRLPKAEVDLLSESGLLGISAPARFGGADLPVPSLVEIRSANSGLGRRIQLLLSRSTLTLGSAALAPTDHPGSAGPPARLGSGRGALAAS